MTYATVDDLTTPFADLGLTVPANAAGLLARASRMVRRATVTALYDVDDDGNPTDATIVTALRDATVEQVAAWTELGVDGVPTDYQTVTAGRLSLGRRTNNTAGAGLTDGTTLAPQALLVLQDANLVGIGPWQP